MSLLDAALALDELAAGGAPGHSHLIAGALALDTLMLRGIADRDLADAALGLKALATGGRLELDDVGRARAAALAAAVRRLNADNERSPGT